MFIVPKANWTDLTNLVYYQQKISETLKYLCENFDSPEYLPIFCEFMAENTLVVKKEFKSSHLKIVNPSSQKLELLT